MDRKTCYCNKNTKALESVDQLRFVLKMGLNLIILNLKEFNTNAVHHHFKMDSIQTILKSLTPNCFMASLDLKDAYYSLPVITAGRKFLRFIWSGELYEFTCLPNRL